VHRITHSTLCRKLKTKIETAVYPINLETTSAHGPALLIVQVALDVPLPTLFDYLCAAEQAPARGLRVVVPFGTPSAKGRADEAGSRKAPPVAVGIIVNVTARSELAPDKLKSVVQVLHDLPPLPEEWFGQVDFCARYYHRPLGEVMLPALPQRLRSGKPLRAVKPKAKPKTKRARTTTAESAPEVEAVPSGVPEVLAAPGFISPHALTDEQGGVIEAVAAELGRYGVHLLLGITGSGKSEVYFQLIARVLAAGRQALVLVPEIALTPALAKGFTERFPGARIALLHSGVAEGARAAAWRAALEGEAHIVLGTRLAAFAPLARPGLIVVDEEQDASFKQQDSLRYNARDLAVYRASQCGVPILLCSATPSLESYQHALSGRYRMHRLAVRAHAEAALPEVKLVDQREHRPRHGLCAPLEQAMAERLARGEQTLVFLNRRGYAPVLSCPACGWVSHCPDCAAHLVVHLVDRRLRCHHCGHAEAVPHACPDCGNVDLQPLGRGTQRMETTLAERFPGARVVRIDADSTRRRGSLEAALEDVQLGRADIILGTQILAKGHHFPRLTLVAVLAADAGLFAADYRASERLFAQLEQVAGRAGRDKLPGEVWIQTRYPQHPLYRAVADHDYAAFAQALLEERRQAGFPPFAYEAALRAEAEDEAAASAFLEAALQAAPEHGPELSVYRPVPMALPRLARMQRVQVVMQSGSRPALQRFLDAWMPALYALRPRKARWHLDVDPTEF